MAALLTASLMAPFSMNLGQNDTEFEAGAERSLCHTGREEDRMPQLLRDENGLALFHALRGGETTLNASLPEGWLFDAADGGLFSVTGAQTQAEASIFLDGQEIVLSSPQNLPQMGNRFQNVHSGLYMVGKLDFDTGRFDVEKIGELDNGFDFYAAQTLRMPDGRVIMISWKEMWDRNYPTQAEGWAGTYSFPREFRMEGTQLIQKPARELDAFCQNRVFCRSLSIDDSEASVSGVSGNVTRIRFTLEPGTAPQAGVKLFCGKEHETVVCYDREEGVIFIDRSKSGIPFRGSEDNVNVRKCDVGQLDSIEFELLLDISSLEVFIDGGRHVMTANVYPDPEDLDVRFFADGGDAVFKEIEKFDVVV